MIDGLIDAALFAFPDDPIIGAVVGDLDELISVVVKKQVSGPPVGFRESINVVTYPAYDRWAGRHVRIAADLVQCLTIGEPGADLACDLRRVE